MSPSLPRERPICRGYNRSTTWVVCCRCEGKEYLKANKIPLKAIFGRIEEAGRAFGRGRSPQVKRAIMNLKFALKMRLSRGDLNAEQVGKIAEAIDAAARVIDEV